MASVVDRWEQRLAELFATAYGQLFGAHPGPFTERDARDGSGLRVDFTFDERRPPLALEVTSIPLQPLQSTAGAMRRVDGGLSELVEKERLGHFTVAVRAGADLRALRPEIEVLMRELAAIEGPGFRPGHYTVEDMDAHPGAELRPFLDRHDRLQGLGLVDVVRDPGRGHGVLTMTMTDFSPEPIGEGLAEALAANADKLGEARRALGAETHLMVVVDAHADPEATMPPSLPPEVDFLWMVCKFEVVPGRPSLWVTRGTWRGWRTIHPAQTVP